MFTTASLSDLPKQQQYDELLRQLSGLLEGESDPIANTANTSALLFHSLGGVNWAGFYFLKSGDLVLGPFQGKPACIRIAMGKGVCGTAAETRETQVVPDVHQFSGHIACDADSRSEIVVPLIRGGEVIGVLDLDSPELARFDVIDRAGLENIVAMLLERSDF